jgi:hypothetical protein
MSGLQKLVKVPECSAHHFSRHSRLLDEPQYSSNRDRIFGRVSSSTIFIFGMTSADRGDHVLESRLVDHDVLDMFQSLIFLA